MELGAFSVSLSVKDIEASRQFYEKIGFKVFMGDQSQKWLIMKNESATIGLFQGIFEGNILTFNPGWNKDAKPLETFTDIRKLQKMFEKNEVSFVSKAEEQSKGPANFMVIDPDGNIILFDQHIE